MAIFDIGALLTGRVNHLGWSLEHRGEKIEKYTDWDRDGLKAYFDGRLVFDWDNEVDDSGPDIHFENLSFPITPETILSVREGYRASSIVDYLANKYARETGDEEKVFTTSGKFRQTWLENTLRRIYEYFSWYETSRRMDIVIANLDKLSGSSGLRDFIKTEVTTGQPVYEYSCTSSCIRAKVIDLSERNRGNQIRTGIVDVRNAPIKLSTPSGRIGESLPYYVVNPQNVRLSGETIEFQEVQVPKEAIDILMSQGLLFTCSSCGKLEWNRNQVLELCSSCCEFTREELELENYSTRAEERLSFKRHKNNRRPPEKTKFLGVELEFECDGEIIHGSYFAKKNLKDHVILKRDGSLDHGLEVVTAPADVDTHKEEFKSFFEKLHSSSLRSAQSSGMHVHVDRGQDLKDFEGNHTSYSKMGLLTIGKLTRFMNAEENVSFLTKIAGRGGNSYSRLGGNDDVLSVLHNKGKGGERYKGLNLTNARTVEFRIFATPTTYEDFCKNIEFCDALTDFCAPGNSSLSQLDEQNFTKYVREHAKSFPNLSRFLKTL